MRPCPSSIAVLVSTVVLAAACNGKKEPPAAGKAADGKGTAAAGRATGGTAAAAEPPRVAPPAKPLPPLEADPGGATGTVEWITTIGGVAGEVPRALAITAGDATVVAGDFEETASFGAAGERTSAGKADVYVARVDAAGKVEWVTTFGGKHHDRGNELAVDAAGNILVGGLFSDTMKAGELSATSRKEGADDLYLAGLDPHGVVQWLWTTGGDDRDDVTAVAAFPGGGWIAAVSFAREIQLGKTVVTSRGMFDAALVKLDAGGEVEWVTPIGGEYNDYIEHVAVDANGNIFTFGRFTRGLDLGGGLLEAIGPHDLFLARFDGAGRHVWSKSIGNAFEEVAGGLAIDQAGGLAVTGSFDKELDFLGTKLTAVGEADAFVARIDADGKLLWAKAVGGDREDIGQAVTVDRAGNVIATGWFETTIDLGAGIFTSKGYRDGWVVKLSPAGAPVWSRRFGDWDHDGPTAVAVASDGSVRLAGLFRYTLDLTSPGPVAVQKQGQKFAKADAFVAKLAR